jgi:hypothetical protein
MAGDVDGLQKTLLRVLSLLSVPLCPLALAILEKQLPFESIQLCCVMALPVFVRSRQSFGQYAQSLFDVSSSPLCLCQHGKHLYLPQASPELL